jgi:uncharacterized membrane protein
MFALPYIPSWDALHPFISHFPIVLLLLAPILILIGLLLPAKRNNLFIIAVWFMVVGTFGVYLSCATGDAARNVAQKTPEISAAIEVHENLGSILRVVFTFLTICLAVLQYAPNILGKKIHPKIFVLLIIVFLVMYGAASLLIFNAAHTGALLVHKLGVHAKI